MKLIKVVLVFCLLAVCVCATPRAAAEERNTSTQVTSTEPVEVPGIVPAAGAYRFARMDPASAATSRRYATRTKVISCRTRNAVSAETPGLRKTGN